VVYAISCGTSIGALFLAGVIPGIVLGLFLMAAAFVWSVKAKYPKREEKVTLKELVVTLREVVFALLMPLIIMGGIISGMFTPTEASAVAVGYAFVITVFVMKTLTFRDLPRLLINAGTTTAIVMMIMGTATLWGWVLAIEQIGDKLAGTLVKFSTPFTFLLMVNIFFLFLCTFMENISAILIFAPILAPIAEKLGIHPIHFGLVFVLNTTIGLITPPLGEVLFIAAPISGLKLDELNISIVGFFLIEVFALFVITYVPWMSLWIPQLFGMLQ
jgi:C4-dicarboxylate transporter DctM subunit